MSQSTQKYILVTSIVWACILAGVLFFVHKRQQSAPANSGAPAPLAEGPPVSSAATPQAPQSSQQVEAPLAPMQLSQTQMQNINMTRGIARYKQLSHALSATGTVAIDERLVSYVQTRFSGYLRRVFVNATYQYVRKGQPLFTIYSPDLVATEQEYLLARENEKTLGGSSIGDVAEGATSLTSAAEQRLAQWEISAGQIAELKRTGHALPDLTINASASGYVTEFNALPNMYATPATRLYTISDLSRVWVNAQVFQTDVSVPMPRARAGSSSTPLSIVAETKAWPISAACRIGISGMLLKPCLASPRSRALADL